MTACKQVKAPRPPKRGGKGGRGNADWQSAQYKESNGVKNATEVNKEDGREGERGRQSRVQIQFGRNKQSQ